MREGDGAALSLPQAFRQAAAAAAAERPHRQPSVSPSASISTGPVCLRASPSVPSAAAVSAPGPRTAELFRVSAPKPSSSEKTLPPAPGSDHAQHAASSGSSRARLWDPSAGKPPGGGRDRHDSAPQRPSPALTPPGAPPCVSRRLGNGWRRRRRAVRQLPVTSRPWRGSGRGTRQVPGPAGRGSPGALMADAFA